MVNRACIKFEILEPMIWFRVNLIYILKGLKHTPVKMKFSPNQSNILCNKYKNKKGYY